MTTSTSPAAFATARTVRLGSLSIRTTPRSVVVAVILAVVVAGLAVVGVLLGDYPLTVLQALQALTGTGADPLAQFFVQQQRLPRVVCAALVGAALAASGSIFQSLSGNPLGSPDVIGFTVGAATGALVEILVVGGGPAAVAAGAVAGGFATAAIVALLAWRGGIAAFRLVLVGIGLAAMLQGLNTLLVAKAPLDAAQSAAVWLAGSFNATTWAEAATVAAALAVCGPAALALARPLSAMTMGDEVATGLGIRVERTRLALLVVGVALVSLAVAAAGPIAFVALAAPQLARRLSRTSGIGMVGSMLMGAALVLAADLVAQRLFAPTQLPVGVVTGALGGLYLIGLLVQQWRRSA